METMYSEASEYARKSYGGNTQIQYKEYKAGPGGQTEVASNSFKANSNRRIIKSHAVLNNF